MWDQPLRLTKTTTRAPSIHVVLTKLVCDNRKKAEERTLPHTELDSQPQIAVTII